jgi:hypothetical protein
LFTTYIKAQLARRLRHTTIEPASRLRKTVCLAPRSRVDSLRGCSPGDPLGIVRLTKGDDQVERAYEVPGLDAQQKIEIVLAGLPGDPPR